MKTLVFEPLIPIALWVTLAVCAAVLLVLYGRDSRSRLRGARWFAMMLLMAVAVALPLGILLNPTWLERLPPPEGKPLLSVLLDASASMATPDGAEGKSRYQEAQQLVGDLRRQLSTRYDVQLRSFAAATSPIEPAELSTLKPEGDFTDLAGAITEVLQADRPQGQAVLVLSDGIHNFGGGEARVVESARRAKAMAAPVYTRTLGGKANVRDLAVEAVSPQELAFVGQTVRVRILLSAKGLAGGPARVALLHDDKQVAEQHAVLRADEPSELDFELSHDTSGVFRYEVRAEPIAEEVTVVNNACTYVLRVIDEPIRVLLLEGKPYWDTKFLMRILAADPSIELVSIVRLAEGRLLQRTLKRPPLAASNPMENPTPTPGGAPAEGSAIELAGRPEEWTILSDASQVLAKADALSSYQIVVLGRDAEVYLTDDALQQLKRWLTRDGGSLVCFRGAPTSQVNQRLSQFLPVRWNAARESRFRMAFTEGGKQLHWVPPDQEVPGDPLAQMPTLARASQPDPQPQAIVWATGQTQGSGEKTPVVTSLPFGTGRVVVVEGAGMWRWAFLAPQYQRHEQIYGALWHSLTRWLVSNTGLLPTQTWALHSDKIRFATTEPATASLLVREKKLNDTMPAIELTGGALTAPRTVTPVPAGDEPGVYRIVFGKLPEGRYSARVAGSDQADSAAQAAFDVRSNVDELLELDANPNLMQHVAEVSGGAVLKTASASELAGQLEAHLARSRPEQIRTMSAWDRWWVLLGVLGVWTAAWGLRRSSGLV